MVEAKRKIERPTFSHRINSSINNKTSPSTTGNGPRQLNFPANFPDMRDIVQKSSLCLLIATMKESENKGCFETILNELLRNNGLSEFKMGNVSPPASLTGSFESNTSIGNDVGVSSLNVISEDGSKSVDDKPDDSHKPTIYKKKGISKITGDNLETLVSDGKAYIESNLEVSDLVKLMKVNCDIVNIVELSASKFNQKFGASAVEKRNNFVLRSNSVIS